jgi:uncharacterized membrane protein
MSQKLISKLKSLLRVVVAGALVFTVLFSSSTPALAAMSGGRIGGGSFSRPSMSRPMPGRTYSAPSRTYSSPRSGYYPAPYPGGGFGFPFLLPFFGIGGGLGGGLFSLLVVIVVANLLMSAFRNATQNSGDGTVTSDSLSNPTVSLNVLQVGLLAEARDLQKELDRIAQAANTGSSEGLNLVLQETTLALQRHPEHWVYASAQSQQSRLEGAETQFNRLALTERSKVQKETLSNVNRQLQQATPTAVLEPADATQLLSKAPSEYIVVSLLTASEGKLELPKINSDQDLRQALNQLGAIPGQRLMALEVLWQPQADGDALTADDLLQAYPHLKLI